MARASGGSCLISMLAHTACRTVSVAGLIYALLLVYAQMLGVLGANAAPALETRAPGDMPLASDVRLAGDESKTRLVVDLDRKIEVRAFALANPYRVIVDMPQVTFAFPDKTGDKGRGLVK